MTSRRRRRLVPSNPVTVFRPGSFGPRHRPKAAGQVEVCACGIQFTRYWAHRQTTHHQRWAKADRLAARSTNRETRFTIREPRNVKAA